MIVTKKLLQKQALAKSTSIGLKLGLTKKEIRAKILKMSIPQLKEIIK